MGKVGRTFTLDLKVLAWLEHYAKKQHKKESYIVNMFLNSAMRQDQTWKCPECQAVNDIQQTSCHSCEYILDFNDLVKA